MSAPLSGSSVVTVSTGDIEIGKVKLLDTAGTNVGVIDASGNLSVNVQNSPSLGTGTNSIGKLGANAGVNIGSVAVLNSVPAQGQYRANTQTLTDGQLTNASLDVNGNLKVTLATTQAGEDIANDVQKVEVRGSFLNITTNATTTVKSGAGVFYGFTINNNGFTTAGTITIYDNTAGSGTKIGTWTVPQSPPGTTLLAADLMPPLLGLNLAFATGLTIVTATTAPAADLTVIYR